MLTLPLVLSFPSLLAVAGAHFWYIAPLIVVVSLVYGATRHELMSVIVQHALRAGIWISGFIATVFVLLWLVSLWV